jgi:ferrous-iron efflux pump FieF
MNQSMDGWSAGRPLRRRHGVVLLLIKIFAWWYTGSVSILAALVDSLVDIAASLTNLLVVRYSLQPADEEHTFGHGKAESLAALAQSMFISGSALFLFLTGIQHLANRRR